jgi:TetR/AcrR family tetracycline transcriptional repressor
MAGDPLTREKIVDAALVVLEREGIHGLSMRKLAQELDAGAATLYWHVGDKEQLLNLLLDRIVGENEVPDADPEHWQEQLKAFARSTRRMFKRRRDAAQLSMGRIPNGPHSLPVLERALALLASAALPPRVISYASDLFALYIGAFAYEESMPPPDTEQMGEFLKTLPPEQFPLMTGLADDLMAGDADERFEWALDLLIAGLEVMALRERRRHEDG